MITGTGSLVTQMLLRKSLVLKTSATSVLTVDGGYCTGEVWSMIRIEMKVQYPAQDSHQWQQNRGSLRWEVDHRKLAKIGKQHKRYL